MGTALPGCVSTSLVSYHHHLSLTSLSFSFLFRQRCQRIAIVQYVSWTIGIMSGRRWSIAGTGEPLVTQAAHSSWTSPCLTRSTRTSGQKELRRALVCMERFRNGLFLSRLFFILRVLLVDEADAQTLGSVWHHTSTRSTAVQLPTISPSPPALSMRTRSFLLLKCLKASSVSSNAISSPHACRIS